jgi:hypothetical protein
MSLKIEKGGQLIVRLYVKLYYQEKKNIFIIEKNKNTFSFNLS